MQKVIISLIAIVLNTSIALPHDIFIGTTDPVHGWGCCNGYSSAPDCKIVSKELLDAGVIKETSTGYHVEMNVEQARQFEATVAKPISEDIEWKRVIPGLSKGFAICIHNNGVQCFLGPSNT